MKRKISTEEMGMSRNLTLRRHGLALVVIVSLIAGWLSRPAG